MLFVGCDGCGRVECHKCPKPHDLLLARVDLDHYLCLECWRAEGMRWPRYTVTPEQQAIQEDATHRKQMKQGGAEKYRVQAGKA